MNRLEVKLLLALAVTFLLLKWGGAFAEEPVIVPRDTETPKWWIRPGGQIGYRAGPLIVEPQKPYWEREQYKVKPIPKVEIESDDE